MKLDAPPIRFAGSELSRVRHVCAFFNSADERYQVLLPFIKDGLERGDRAVHIVAECDHADHTHRLEGAGIDVAAAEDGGRLTLLSSTDAYLKDGHFDQERMLEVFKQMATSTPSQDHVTRFVCQMEWAAQAGRSQIDDLLEFESRVNDVWRANDDAVICVYDLAKFSGETIIDVMRTHPMIIIGGVLQENPFYVPPAQFIDDLRVRHGRPPPESSDG